MTAPLAAIGRTAVFGSFCILPMAPQSAQPIRYDGAGPLVGTGTGDGTEADAVRNAPRNDFFRPRFPRLRRHLLRGLIVVVAIWGLTDVRRRGQPHPENPLKHRTDLTVYTEAGAAFFDGRPPYDVSNPRGWRYLYPPLLAMVLAPLHVLPMQDQVVVWFFVSVLACWGCFRESRLIVRTLYEEDSGLRTRCARWFPWLGLTALAAGLFPTLNCLQRGQVGVVMLYLLLLGLRLILRGRSYRAWIAGGMALAVPVVIKVIPILPVAFLLLAQLAAALRKMAPADRGHVTIRRQLAGSTAGVALGLGLLFFVIPGTLIGFQANMRHLHTWSRIVLGRPDTSGEDRFGGLEQHTVRNQCLNNAAYCLGNFLSYALADGPDDRLVQTSDPPPMAMDAPMVERCLLGLRLLLLLALLATGVRLARGDDRDRGKNNCCDMAVGHVSNVPGTMESCPTDCACDPELSQALGCALACVAMLVVSPISRGHYFMFLVPAVLLLPLWLDRRGMPRAAVAMAILPAVLSVTHYAFLHQAGRIGLLGLGTTCWLIAAMVLVQTAGRRRLEAGVLDAAAAPSHPAVPIDQAA